jgi:predicted nucleic acid-binding protein
MIAIDTCVLIWGVKEHRQHGREEMIDRCKWLIRDHQQRKIPIMVPSVALAEYLSDFTEAEQMAQREIIGRSYYIASFDSAAAWQAALLFDRERIRAIKSNGTPKQCVHADLKIIATAISQGAIELYTDNVKDFRSLAHGSLTVKDIPEIPLAQAKLPGIEG